MRINSNDPLAYSKLNRNNSIKSDTEDKSNKEDKLSNNIPLKDTVKIRPAVKLDESEFTNMSLETKDPGYAKKLLDSAKNDILSNATAAISAQANQKPDSLIRLLK